MGIRRHRPKESTVSAEIQLRPPFHGIFQNLKKKSKNLLMKKSGFKPEFSRFILCLRKYFFFFKISNLQIWLLLTKYQIWRSHENNLKIWDFTQANMSEIQEGIWKKERFYITRHFRGESIFRLICITADLIYNHGSKRNIIWNHQRFGHTQHKHEEVQGYGGGVIKKENKTCWKIDVFFKFNPNQIVLQSLKWWVKCRPNWVKHLTHKLISILKLMKQSRHWYDKQEVFFFSWPNEPSIKMTAGNDLWVHFHKHVS